MCTFRSVWHSCANFRTGHGRVGRLLAENRTCPLYPRCELLVSRHPMMLPYDCYNCMHQRQAVRRDNLFTVMQTVQMPIRSVPERLVPALSDGPEPVRPGLPMAEEEREPVPEVEEPEAEPEPEPEEAAARVYPYFEEPRFIYRGLI